MVPEEFEVIVMAKEQVQLIHLPKIIDTRGNLSFIESQKHIPFKIERTYWIYDVPGGEIRFGHAYKTQQEFIVALSGSFDVIISSNEKVITHSLNRSYYGLYIPCLTWRSIENFSTNALCLILSSGKYDSNDYIRNFSLLKTI